MARGRHEDTGLPRRRRIARELGLEEKGKPGQFQGPCPLCGRPGFSIMRPDDANWLHIWVCAAGRKHLCTDAAVREWLLGHFPAQWLGGYGETRSAIDPQQSRRLREAADIILANSGLDPSWMRIMLADARGDKIPDDYSGFARFAQSIGIGKSHSYRLAGRFSRSSSVPHPGGRSADAKS